MQVTIDHHGGWYRWKITVGDGLGSTFAEGKSGSFSGARDVAYAVVATMCRDDNAGARNIPQFRLLWDRVQWFESPAAKAHAGIDSERQLKAIFAAGEARRAKTHNAQHNRPASAGPG
jgi:hypothetical protein